MRRDLNKNLSGHEVFYTNSLDHQQKTRCVVNFITRKILIEFSFDIRSSADGEDAAARGSGARPSLGGRGDAGFGRGHGRQGRGDPPPSSECGTYKTVKARMWHIQDIQG
jgi:hypothetical protein